MAPLKAVLWIRVSGAKTTEQTKIYDKRNWQCVKENAKRSKVYINATQPKKARTAFTTHVRASRT